METEESSFGASSFIPCSREICYIFLLSARPFVKWVGKANRRVMDPTGNSKNWRKTLTRLALRLPTCSFNRLTVEPRNRLLPQSCTVLAVHFFTRLLLYSSTTSPVYFFTHVYLNRLRLLPFTASLLYYLTRLLLYPVYFFACILPHPFTPPSVHYVTRFLPQQITPSPVSFCCLLIYLV